MRPLPIVSQRLLGQGERSGSASPLPARPCGSVDSRPGVLYGASAVRSGLQIQPQPTAPRQPHLLIRHLVGVFILLAVVAMGSSIRISRVLTDPLFNMQSPQGLLRSDIALLYYFLDRIVESKGLPPADFRADRYVEHPNLTDLPATFTICQEFLIAWCSLLYGGAVPLHVLCVIVMGIFASLCAVGVYGLAIELTGKVRWAAGAALLYALSPANYRTVGFILIREDFSLPWFALHLFLLARAARIGTRTSYVLCALSLVLALASWHAMGFVVAIEAACFFAWFLRSGRNPLAAPNVWLLTATVALAALCVPVLRSKVFILSLPMQLAVGLLSAAAFARRPHPTHLAKIAVAIAGLSAALALSMTVSALLGSGLSDYAHVFQFIMAKVRHLGHRPEDPNVIRFGARLLWQGPFATAALADFWYGMRAGSFLLPLAALWAIPAWWSGRGEARLAIFALCGVVSIAVAFLAVRLIILPALIAPVIAAVLLSRLQPKGVGLALMVVAIVIEAGLMAEFASRYRFRFYHPDTEARARVELEQVLSIIPQYVPDGEAIAADYVTSSAVLAHTRHPILLQPKYETPESRRRIEEFLTTFMKGTCEEFRLLLLRYQCHYVLISRHTLWPDRYLAGIPKSVKRPTDGTAAASFCSPDDAVLRGIPGFDLLYRSPRHKPYLDEFRLYRVE